MSFPLVPKSVTLNDRERRNSPYFALFHEFGSSGAHCVKVVEDVVIKRFNRSRSLSHHLMSFLYVIGT